MGSRAEIEELIAPIVDQISMTGGVWYDANRNVRSLLALLYCDIGQADKARAEFDRLAAHDFTDIARDPLWLNTLVFLVEACIQLQDLPRAARLYGLLVPYAGRNVMNRQGMICFGSASHYLGLLATTLSRWDDASQYFADSLAMNLRMGAKPFAAHTQHAWAELLVTRGRPEDADQALALAQQSLATAEELGMTRLAQRVGSLIGTLTALLPTSRQHAAFGLSPRELDVLRLLVDGRSDREIADALFISHRTVMTHVANILNKLAVSSRTAAASYAVRERIV